MAKLARIKLYQGSAVFGSLLPTSGAPSGSSSSGRAISLLGCGVALVVWLPALGDAVGSLSPPPSGIGASVTLISSTTGEAVGIGDGVGVVDCPGVAAAVAVGEVAVGVFVGAAVGEAVVVGGSVGVVVGEAVAVGEASGVAVAVAVGVVVGTTVGVAVAVGDGSGVG